jgi:hypothetical protein
MRRISQSWEGRVEESSVCERISYAEVFPSSAFIYLALTKLAGKVARPRYQVNAFALPILRASLDSPFLCRLREKRLCLHQTAVLL